MSGHLSFSWVEWGLKLGKKLGQNLGKESMQVGEEIKVAGV